MVNKHEQKSHRVASVADTGNPPTESVLNQYRRLAYRRKQRTITVHTHLPSLRKIEPIVPGPPRPNVAETTSPLRATLAACPTPFTMIFVSVRERGALGGRASTGPRIRRRPEALNAARTGDLARSWRALLPVARLRPGRHDEACDPPLITTTSCELTVSALDEGRRECAPTCTRTSAHLARSQRPTAWRAHPLADEADMRISLPVRAAAR